MSLVRLALNIAAGAAGHHGTDLAHPDIHHGDFTDIHAGDIDTASHDLVVADAPVHFVTGEGAAPSGHDVVRMPGAHALSSQLFPDVARDDGGTGGGGGIGPTAPGGGPNNDPDRAFDMGATSSNGGPSNDPDRAMVSGVQASTIYGGPEQTNGFGQTPKDIWGNNLGRNGQGGQPGNIWGTPKL